MKFSGEIEIAAPRDVVFARLADPQVFAACLEGVSDLRQIDESGYRAVLETKVAYLSFRFYVDVRLTHVEPPSLLEGRIEGTPRGLVGRLTATARTRLMETEAGTTIAYEVDAALTGKLGSLGQPVLRAKASEMERGFSARLRRLLEPQQ